MENSFTLKNLKKEQNYRTYVRKYCKIGCKLVQGVV